MAKLGETALRGYWQQGCAEIRAAAPYGDSPIAQPTSALLPGVATQGEIAASRRDESMSLEGDSILDERLKLAEASRDDPGKEDRGMDRD